MGIRSTNEINIGLIIPLLIFPDFLYRITLSGQGRMTFVSLIYILVYLFLYRYPYFRKIAFSFPLKIWILLTLYHLINASLKHVPEINFADYLHGFKIYASICIFAFLFKVNIKKAMSVLYYSIGIWLILAFAISGFNDSGRLSSEGGGFAAVTFGKSAAIMAIAAVYYTTFQQTSIIYLLLRIIYPLAFIFMSQTRNAFGMVLIQLAGYYYAIAMKCKITMKHAILVVFLMIGTYVGVNYVMENTGLGTRFQNDFERAENQDSKYQTGTYWDYVLGERISYYIIGWQLFINNPVTGIGLDNYKNITEGGYPMHVEYMKHLAEGGIIAAVLWLAFIFALIRVLKKSHYPKHIKYLMTSTLILELFTLFFSVSYEQELSVIPYAVILSAYNLDATKKTNNCELIKTNK